MYWISSGLDKVIDIRTLKEYEVSTYKIIQLLQSNQIVPNAGDTLQVFTNDWTVKPELYKLTNLSCEVQNRDKDVILLSESRGIYLFSKYKDSWRNNKLFYSNLGVTVMGDGESTYVHYKDYVYKISGMTVIYGLFFDEYGTLCLRFYKQGLCEYTLRLEGHSLKNEMVTMECIQGGIVTMKRMMVLRD